ncbi:inositol-tetrakisphosphate 1-kinase [Phycomyces nitens]|nr:inositol-tetrakisphosphate 1-kinase [Phycomyces nitens]
MLIKKTVGLIFRKEKIKRSGFCGLAEYAIQHGIQIIFLDLNVPIANQGHFDLIVHKITDVVGKMHLGDENCAAQFENFVTYCESHPQVIVMDAWKDIEKVIDRSKLQCQLERIPESNPHQTRGINIYIYIYVCVGHVEIL